MIIIPVKLKAKLDQDQRLSGIVYQTASDFGKIFRANNLEFFPEYTDHGIKHIESVLLASENIIEDRTLQEILTPKDVAVLILSIFLHDLGMHLSFVGFKNLIEGKHDSVLMPIFDEKTWSQLWEEYLDEAKKFSGKKRKAIFGNEFQNFRRPVLENDLDLTKADRILIGEFIRRHHARLAHEVALIGLLGKPNEQGNEQVVDFASNLDTHLKKIAGVVARSHGMELRDTFEYLKEISEEQWIEPYGVKVVF